MYTVCTHTCRHSILSTSLNFSLKPFRLLNICIWVLCVWECGCECLWGIYLTCGCLTGYVSIWTAHHSIFFPWTFLYMLPHCQCVLQVALWYFGPTGCHSCTVSHRLVKVFDCVAFFFFFQYHKHIMENTLKTTCETITSQGCPLNDPLFKTSFGRVCVFSLHNCARKRAT